VNIKEIGLCGYAEPDDDGDIECRASGLRITVKDGLGNLVSIVRCKEHSDWIEHETVSSKIG